MFRRIMLGLLLLALFSPVQAFADYSVYVGYADNLRPSPNFPSPFGSVAYFNGGGGSYDAGAVMIVNTGLSNITVDGLNVTLQPNLTPWNLNIWGSLSQVLAPGDAAVFTQTYAYNFDTSDDGFVPVDITNNCSVGSLSTTALCINNAPLVTFTVDGSASGLVDTGHVLDTGGFDSVYSNPCPDRQDNNPGNCNESLQWRLIGTTGVQDPTGGGSVPEPGTMLLIGSGLIGLALWGRKLSLV